jgi:hypothetical protein
MLLMHSTIKPFNNTHTFPKKTHIFNSEKNLWCRNIYWKVINDELGICPFKQTNGCQLRSCSRESHECRGAHDISELKPFNHIQKFNRLNKASYNWSLLFFEITSSLKKDGQQVKLDEHKLIIANVPRFNFFEAIRTWKDMACYYRKIAKKLPSRKNPNDEHYEISEELLSSGFTYSEDVPKFYISSDIEDTAWGFERQTRWCPEHQKFKQSIRLNQLITIWDLCLATGLNCKEGIHENNEKICEEDFLNGRCSCQSLEQFSAKQDELQAKILDISNQIQEIIKHENSVEKKSSDDTFVQIKSRKSKKQQRFDPKLMLIHTLDKLNKELKYFHKSRLIHYSEFGMIPFEIQYQKWTESQKEIEAITKLTVESSIKESWNHELIDNVKITKPVIKISKFGSKSKKQANK